LISIDCTYKEKVKVVKQTSRGTKLTVFEEKRGAKAYLRVNTGNWGAAHGICGVLYMLVKA
jgi:hypothetical protein